MGQPYLLPLSSHQDRPVKLGETLSFFAALLNSDSARKIYDGTIHWKLERNASEVIGTGKYSTASYAQGVSFVADTPGYFKCTFHAELEGQNVPDVAIGALVEPELIKPSLPVPEDFDQFWKQHTAAVDAIPINTKLTPIEATQAVEIFDLQADCINDTPVSGIFARPTNARPGAHPALLVVQGAGVRSGGEGRFVSFAHKGFLSLDINAHGLPNGQPPQYYLDISNNQLLNYPQRGFETGDPEKVYMLGVFLRVYRALQALMAMPEWDGKNLWVFGGSQGSWQSFAGAALCKNVSGMGTWIPAGCDLAGGGWPFSCLINKSISPEMKKTLPYFDSTSFATRIHGASFYTALGLIDATCKADGVMAACNSLNTSDKTIVYHYLMNHETPEALIADLERFIMSHLR